MNASKLVVIWFAGFIVYLLVASRLTIYDAVMGAITGLVSAIVFSELLVNNPGKVLSLKRWLYGLAYILYYLFVIEPVQHFKVALMILGLKSIDPDIVRVPYRYDSIYSIAAAANSITNTPGTLVVEVDPGRKEYYVHWIKVETREPREIYFLILGCFDEWIKKIFEG